MATTIHGTSTSNHDPKVVHYMDVAMCLLGDLVVNKVMGATTFNEDNGFMMFNVPN
jgi:hypothetical protein